MGLRVETFDNIHGGSTVFKALDHPLVAAPARRLIGRLRKEGKVALYDPLGLADGFAQLHDVSDVQFVGAFVQNVDDLGRSLLGQSTRPVTELPDSGAAIVFVAAFEAERLIAHIRHLIPDAAEIVSFDDIRLPDDMLSHPRRYLDPLNFATNLAFFRDGDGHHTRLVTANYWAGYDGGAPVSLWLCLFSESGAELAQWREELSAGQSGIAIDSREVRERFGLDAFCGQLFLHVVGAAGHDVVKYALDTYGDDDTVLSCTHDANAWPAEFYAGLPAPDAGERVVLWVQNSHLTPIPPGGVGLNLMGKDKEAVWLDEEIPPFATRALDVSELLPKARWPQQIEIRAGKYFVRPRYEVISANGRTRIAHANVERTDLAPDPRIPELANLLGKGHLLPAPVLPPERWRSVALPTPMATSQRDLPVAALLYDASGREAAVHQFGRLDRAECVSLEIDDLLKANGGLPSGYGHMELVYDFAEGGAADGWLHGLFRYEDRQSGHAAETSFGAHIFNTVLRYRSEPQSYAGPPPGLSTRLFLRLGIEPLETFCQLIYPASTPWREQSSTELILHDGAGEEVARESVEIPCGGSLLWHYSETFAAAERRRAGPGGYVIVRDTTCRLFGYHGLMNGAGAFSLDHMFGF